MVTNKLSIRTRHSDNRPQYTGNLNNVLIFLNSMATEKIEVRGESVIIDIYENGKLIFSDTKEKFFQQLKK
jgi:hypothetical protein